MLSPLMACSARLPVYTLLIAAIVPNEKVLGFIAMPGLVMFALYAFAIITSFIIAFVTKATAITPTASRLMMELPAYRVPKMKNVLYSAFQKGYLFLKKAGTVIFVLSIIIWGLVTFPNAPKNATDPAINYSAAAKIGNTLEPIFRPLGFDWKMTTALIPSFAAREVLVSALGTVMNVDAENDDKLIDSLSSRLSAEYSMASLMALLVWFVFSPQCIATIAVMKKETNGYKIPIMFLAYTLSLAYVASLITFNLFSM
jgi:ferrous iron transport protein B